MRKSLSVIIPTCKRLDFLKAALDSAEQARDSAGISTDDFQIVVVDDAHESAVQNWCEEYRTGHNLDVGYHKSSKGPRSGPSACRDQGIRLASGEFIFLLDDDDAFLPNRFKNSIRLLAEEGYDVVLEPSLREYVNHPEKASFITGPFGSPDNAFRFLMTGGPRSHITPGATSFRRKLYEQIGGYDKELRYGEDGELLFRLCLGGRVALVEGEPVVRIAIHEDNSSRPDRLRYWQNIKAMARLYQTMRAGTWVKETAIVRSALSGKFDFVLTEIRRTAPTYAARLGAGLAVLWHYDWRCTSVNNLKSIAVWLAKGRDS